MQWYLARDGARSGPFEDQEFHAMAQDGRLKPSDHVWNETMGSEWALASDVPGLLPSGAAPASRGRLTLASQPVNDGRGRENTSSTAGREPENVSRLESPVGTVSCSAPVGVAWDDMKEILFRPFDIGKWFILGFTAWLATLGSGGFGNGGGGGSPGSSSTDGFNKADFQSAMEQVRVFLSEHGGKILSIGLLIAVIVFAVWLVLLWLRSRGRFMFLDNVVNNRAEVGKPWRVFDQHGNSLFMWNAVYAALCLLIALALVGLTAVGVAIPAVRAGHLTSGAVTALVFFGMLWILFALVTAYIGRFLEDFVVPLMYKHDLSCTKAWGRFLKLFGDNKGRFIGYGFFYLLLSMLAGVCILGIMIVTCCIAGCLLAIPYLGAVLLLPATVFFRCYSVEYLAQYGVFYTLEPEPDPEFDADGVQPSP